MQQDVAKAAKGAKVSNKNFAAKPDETDMFDNLEVANMSVSTAGAYTNTHGIGIFDAETMGIFGIPDSTSGSLLVLANGLSIVLESHCPIGRGT
jgi:hypothetical protein